MTRSQVSPWVVRGLYLFAIVLVVSPLIDFVSTVWPLRPGDLQWRYGFLGLGAGFLHTPILGLVLAMAVAYWQDHLSVLRRLGVLSAVAAAAILPVLLEFPLDVLAMRELRAQDAQTGALIGAIIQEVKYLGACLVLACLGVGGMRTAKQLMATSGAEASPGIVSRAGR